MPIAFLPVHVPRHMDYAINEQGLVCLKLKAINQGEEIYLNSPHLVKITLFGQSVRVLQFNTNDRQ